MANDWTPPRVSAGRRFRRQFSRYLPGLVWVVGAVVAGWLYAHDRPRSQAVATTDYTEVRVISEVSGRILRLAVQEGQSVREGETLAVLDPRDLDERIERLRGLLDQVRKLAEPPKDEVKLYELKLADLEKEKLKYTVVARAPGRIENLALRPGDWLNPGTEIGVIEAGKPGRVTAYLTDPRPPAIVRGTRTMLRPRSKTGVALAGRVTKVSPHVEPVPDRIHHQTPSLSTWGRSVTIEFDRAGDFSPGEVYDVNFLP